jgi:hypothetical protein
MAALAAGIVDVDVRQTRRALDKGYRQTQLRLYNVTSHTVPLRVAAQYSHRHG